MQMVIVGRGRGPISSILRAKIPVFFVLLLSVLYSMSCTMLCGQKEQWCEAVRPKSFGKRECSALFSTQTHLLQTRTCTLTQPVEMSLNKDVAFQSNGCTIQ